MITGGGSGLGFGIAKVFIEAGAEVIILGCNEEKLRVAQQQLGERCLSPCRCWSIRSILTIYVPGEGRNQPLYLPPPYLRP